MSGYASGVYLLKMENDLVTLLKFIVMDTTLLNRITTNPAVLTGKPIIRGMRISVEHVLKILARGISNAAIIDEYPTLEEDDIKACLLYVAKEKDDKNYRF